MPRLVLVINGALDKHPYIRFGKVYFSGLGLITRLGEQLDYWDGED